MDKIQPSQITMEPSAEAPAERPARGGGPVKPNRIERRSEVRYPISASAILIDPKTRIRLLGRATDLSASGCYMDTINPFPVGGLVRLQLTSEDRLFRSGACVTYSLPGMGMGLTFTDMANDQGIVLRDWIAELSGALAAKPSLESETDFAFGTLAAPEKTVSLQDVVYELVTLLHQKGLLTQAETDAFRKRLFP